MEDEILTDPFKDLKTIVGFLSSIELFKNIPNDSLRALAEAMNIIYVEGGKTLIEQGDIDTSMYILYQGRLRVFKKESSKVEEEAISEILVGQFVGEIALLTHLPRTSTVKAVRDSILFELEEQAFKDFEVRHPHEVVGIAKMALNRVAMKPRTAQIGENAMSLTIVPAGHSNHRPFISRLVEEISQTKTAVVINKDLYFAHFGRDAEQTHEFSTIALNIWLKELENQYDYLIFETDDEMTPWTQCCLKRSDRRILIVEPNQIPELNSIEMTLFTKGSPVCPYTELAFIHDSKQTVIAGSGEWLKERQCNGFHHIRLDSKPDWQRFLRFINGHALGIVLNGGGMRGVSHLGVLKALEELNVPIDFIGGASAGAGIGAMYICLGLSEAIDFATTHFPKFPKEWTLPVLSLSKGKMLSELCHQFSNDYNIEDLWTRFFCVSTNVAQAKLEIFDRGKVWLAVRCSLSVPALYPPMYDDQGCMLVDGGMINNMPVDIMRKKLSGGKVLAVDCHQLPTTIPKREHPMGWISGWELFLNKFSHLIKEQEEYDGILDVIYGSIDAGLAFHQKLMMNSADYVLQLDTNQYGFLEFSKTKEIIELGYQQSLEKLPQILKPL